MKATDSAVILVVDNDPSVRNYLAHVIQGAGYECVTAATGAQALAEWQDRSFDLVVTDLNMPNGDGIALAKALQRSEAVPIVFITGFAGDHKKGIAQVKGAAVLEKPFDADDLLQLIGLKLTGRVVGDSGRQALVDGRGHWQGGGLASSIWHEGLSLPRTGGGDEDIDSLGDDDQEDTQGLK
ncbi:MAG: response regulator [bacterium]|jgi:CheY-like chemotaxis protein